ncbi:MAG: hypothetical protein LBF89_09005 [Bacteroidales bacterium]|jgi:hypothetical protein|nr:hypothetical protein [Bacteroidales bacterium]
MSRKKEKRSKKSPPAWFERLEDYFNRRHGLFAGLLLAVAAFFSFLLFESKINMMGDDSDYLVHSYKFVHEFRFPSSRGAFYPILLSPFIAVFGINIVLLKTLSALMVLASLFLLYKALYRRIPSAILFPCLLLLSINGSLLWYSSAILSEPLFMLFQSLLLFFFGRFYLDRKEVSFRENILRCFLLAVLILCLTLTRTVGYAAIGVFVIYFLFAKQWKNAGLTLFANGVVFALFRVLKDAVWPQSGDPYRLQVFFTKDFYSPGKGMEDAGGLVIRLIENINNYMSKYIAEFLGLKTDITVSSVPLTVILCLLCIWGGYMAFMKNKTLLLVALHTIGFCLANFILLHASWQQERFVIVYYPLILLIILSGIYYHLQPKRGLQFVYVILCAVVFVGTLNHSVARVKANTASLGKLMKGNILYGLPPDWENYIRMSQWAAENTPDSVKIASRKPSTSTIYTNRDFYGIISVPNVLRDSLDKWKPAANKTVIVTDISSKNLLMLTPAMRYVLNGEIKISDVTTLMCGVYEVDDNEVDDIIIELKQNEIAYTDNFEQFKKTFYEREGNLIYSPENMLDRLKKGRVRYMILASLRVNPNQYTGRIINTLHNYAHIMALKYPGIIVEKHTIGNNEPATLIELRY